VNDVPVQDRACGIHEEEAASGAKRVVDAVPEPVGIAVGNVRKPERKEDDVIVLIWLPAEEIVNPELDIALTGILQLRQSEFAHLRRCIDSDKIPADGPAIIAPNHFSFLDHFFVAVYLRRKVNFMGTE
jgi:hypothetical protein